MAAPAAEAAAIFHVRGVEKRDIVSGFLRALYKGRNQPVVFAPRRGERKYDDILLKEKPPIYMILIIL
jgi:hypothetical protein